MTLFYGVFYGTKVGGDFTSLILIAVCGKKSSSKNQQNNVVSNHL